MTPLCPDLAANGGGEFSASPEHNLSPFAGDFPPVSLAVKSALRSQWILRHRHKSIPSQLGVRRPGPAALPAFSCPQGMKKNRERGCTIPPTHTSLACGTRWCSDSLHQYSACLKPQQDGGGLGFFFVDGNIFKKSVYLHPLKAQ